MPIPVRCVPVLSLVTAAALGGCATPAPLVRLVPKEPNAVWVSGRASLTREAVGVRVAVAFEHQDGANLGIHVEVQNTTDATLEADPHQFTFTTCRAEAVGTCGPTYRVIDPEQVLISLDVRQSTERANAANSQAFLGTLVVLNAVADTATIASGHANVHTGEGTMAAASMASADAASRQSGLASIDVQRAIWSNEAFRRNTLLPGRGAAGLVYIPIDMDAQIVWLHIRTAGHDFSFPFQQVVTQVAPSTSSRVY